MKKKTKRIYSTATAIIKEILGESVELRPHPALFSIDVRYCSRVGCEGCNFHAFGIGGLDHPQMPWDLPREIYANVGRYALDHAPSIERVVAGVTVAWGQECVGDA